MRILFLVIRILHFIFQQFHYSDDSALVHIRNVTLTSSLETISEIQISDDREFYYGLSNQNVSKK